MGWHIYALCAWLFVSAWLGSSVILYEDQDSPAGGRAGLSMCLGFIMAFVVPMILLWALVRK